LGYSKKNSTSEFSKIELNGNIQGRKRVKKYFGGTKKEQEALPTYVLL